MMKARHFHYRIVVQVVILGGAQKILKGTIKIELTCGVAELHNPLVCVSDETPAEVQHRVQNLDDGNDAFTRHWQ